MAVRLYRKLAVAYIQASRDHEVCRLGSQQTRLRISCFQPEPVVAYAGPEHCSGRSGHVPDVPDVPGVPDVLDVPDKLVFRTFFPRCSRTLFRTFRTLFRTAIWLIWAWNDRNIEDNKNNKIQLG